MINCEQSFERRRIAIFRALQMFGQPIRFKQDGMKKWSLVARCKCKLTASHQRRMFALRSHSSSDAQIACVAVNQELRML